MAAFNFPNSPSTNDIHTENNVSWKWIRGHSGHEKNERADALARRGVREIVD